MNVAKRMFILVVIFITGCSTDQVSMEEYNKLKKNYEILSEEVDERVRGQKLLEVDYNSLLIRDEENKEVIDNLITVGEKNKQVLVDLEDEIEILRNKVTYLNDELLDREEKLNRVQMKYDSINSQSTSNQGTTDFYSLYVEHFVDHSEQDVDVLAAVLYFLDVEKSVFENTFIDFDSENNKEYLGIEGLESYTLVQDEYTSFKDIFEVSNDHLSYDCWLKMNSVWNRYEEYDNRLFALAGEGSHTSFPDLSKVVLFDLRNIEDDLYSVNVAIPMEHNMSTIEYPFLDGQMKYVLDHWYNRAMSFEFTYDGRIVIIQDFEYITGL